MKKILLTLFIFSSFLIASSTPEKAYETGKKLALKIDKKTPRTVKEQKCKFFVLLEKSISAIHRPDAYHGCEDGINSYYK